ncbi:MAG: hypothetical protein QF384_15020, partial [Alphaproteobacteria bacterium]|nr:hypothetical protein [Alphaproteobacteria bacterium]
YRVANTALAGLPIFSGSYRHLRGRIGGGKKNLLMAMGFDYGRGKTINLSWILLPGPVPGMALGPPL